MIYSNGQYRVEAMLLDGVTWYGVFDNSSKGLIWATPEKRKAIEQADYYARIL